VKSGVVPLHLQSPPTSSTNLHGYPVTSSGNETRQRMEKHKTHRGCRVGIKNPRMEIRWDDV